MKSFLIASLLVLASLSTQAALPYQQGDVFLGFRASGGTGVNQDYPVNLGPVTAFTGASGSVILGNIGNIAPDLALVFGADWYSRPDLFWSVSGAYAPADTQDTLYVSRARASASGPAQPWKRRSPSAQGTITSTFFTLANGYIPGAATGNSARASIQNTGSINSYASFQPGGTAVNSGGVSFAAFNPTIENNFANGAASSVLDFFQLVPSTTPDLDGVAVGSFVLDRGGNLIFTPAGQTPLTTLRLEQTSYQVNETGSNVTLTVKAIRGGNVSGILSTATVSTQDGTAKAADGDYAALTNAPLSFADGEEETTFDVTVLPHSGFQGDRTFQVSLGGTGVTLDDSTASIKIIENSQNPSGLLTFSAATYSSPSVTATGAPSLLNITLSRGPGVTGTVTVDVATTGGTLVSGTDYAALASPTTVSFGPGAATKSFTLPLNSIDKVKLPGTITLALSNPGGGAQLGAQTTATVTVTFAPQPPLAGVYSGILVPAAGGQPGFVTVTTTAARGFSGKVRLGAVTKSISGKFGPDGAALFKPANASSLAVAGIGTITLAVDGNTLTGSVANGATTVASLEADRGYFDGKSPATTLDSDYLQTAKQGVYTVILPALGTQPGGLTGADYPQGTGYARVVLSKTGAITLSGKLADGTTLSGSGKLAQDYSWQPFVPLYGNQGSLSGSVSFDKTK